MVRGSCLCGDLAWGADGPFEMMSHCHCSRCRKAVSGAYATDFATPEQGFRWLRGDERVRDFSLRGAKWFATSFCDTCGSVMPHALRSNRSKVLIQAGALDGDPEIRVTQHIFVASKAPWVEITDALPRFAEYAPKTG